MRNWVWAQRRGRGPGRASHSNQASLVWRAPCGLVGLAAVPVGGGGAWPGFEATRRAAGSRVAISRAGRRPPAHTAAGPHSRGLRRPEHPWGAQSSPAQQGTQSSPAQQGTQSSPAQQGAQSSPARQGVQTKTSGTGRRHDPRLGRQGTQSCNPESIRNVGGATRPGHSQGRPDKRNDVLGGPAQASEVREGDGTVALGQPGP